MIKLISYCCLILLIHSFAEAQEPAASFIFPEQTYTVCRGEIIKAQNTSTNASLYLWDFCPETFSETPDTNNPVTINNLGNGWAYKAVKSGNEWFGFLASRSTNRLFRLEFGTDPGSNPTVYDLGNPGGLLISPQGMDLVHNNGNWYLFLGKGESTTGQIVRIDFGTNLKNTPSAVGMGTFGVIGSKLRDVSIVKQGSDLILLIIVDTGNSIKRVNFRDSFNNPINPEHITSTGILTGASLPLGFSVIKVNGNWIVHTVSFLNNGIQQYNFGTNILGSPVFEGTLNFTSVLKPYYIKIVREGSDYLGFIANENSRLSIINFHDLSGSIPPTELPNTSLQRVIGFDILKYKSKNIIQGTITGTSSFTQMSFENNSCGASKTWDENYEPSDVYFNSSGDNVIELMAISDDNFVDVTSEALSITGSTAPTVQILNDNLCISSAISFSVASTETLKSWSWDFGDNSTAVVSNPVHQYSASSLYQVELSVTDINECVVNIAKTLPIYSEPTASFALPTGPICTNNEFTFTNSTLDNFDGNLTYEWFVNDVQKSTFRDFRYAFNTVGDQQVKLKTSIPGCSSELTQSILNVQTGPVADFSYTGKCEDEAILFANQSSGLITGFQWDFANSNTSTEENPSEMFSDYGNYSVSLSAIATNGCVTTVKKPVTIYSVPQTNFTIDLPPFACSGSPSQFNDATPPMPDSNITSWTWSFGDQSSGTSSQKNPTYTYAVDGDYSVSLTTTTNYGCSNSTQQTVTIYPSPKADYSFGPACVDQGTQFTDLSTGDIKSWLWTIQGSTYSAKNPIHIFNSADTHHALLTVTATNDCINQISGNVTVPVPVVVDFTSQGTCATKVSAFQSLNNDGYDPAISWSWNFANQAAASGAGAQHVFPSTGNYFVTLNSTRQSGCTYSFTRTIRIIEPPKAQFTVSMDAGAPPFPVDFANTSLGASTYLWKFGDASNSSTEFSPSHTYNELGDYMAELMAFNAIGCTDSYSQLIRVVVPQINAAISDFRFEKNPESNTWSSVVTIENKSNVTLINTDIYLDIPGNTLISEKITGPIKPSESLVYTFANTMAPIAFDFACAEIKVNADEYLFDNRQCVNVTEPFVSLIPYPNPADHELILEWINDSSEPMDVIIYNSAGQSVMTRQYSPTLKGLNQVKVDVSLLAAGIYFVSYTVDGQVQNFKFSVAR